MMNFRQWQVINEHYGHFALGVKTPKSIGAVGSKLAEMGLRPDYMADDPSGDMGDDPGMDGMDDLGMGGDQGMGMDDLGMGDDSGMGGMDDLGMGDDQGMSGPGSGEGGLITIDDLDPTLQALLGLHPRQPSRPTSSFGGEIGGGEDMGQLGDEEGSDEEGGNPFAGGDEEGDEEGGPFGGGDEEGDEEEGTPFGGEEGDDEEGAEDSGNPFGGKSSGSSEKDSDGDGETDEVDDDDDNDGESDEVDDDDDGDGVPDVAEKKKCNSGKKMYSKKFMGKNMKQCCNNEDVAFLNGLVKMGRGNVHQKFESGMPHQKRRTPRAGQVGYAPQGRLGQNW